MDLKRATNVVPKKVLYKDESVYNKKFPREEVSHKGGGGGATIHI